MFWSVQGDKITPNEYYALPYYYKDISIATEQSYQYTDRDGSYR